MSMDIESVLKTMAGAGLGVLKTYPPELRASFQAMLAEQREDLALLGAARAAGEIDAVEFQSELERSEKVLEVKLLTLEIEGKAAAQKMAEAACEAFRTAIKVLV